eukprot:TRINITY_DN396_c0_g1_i1.p2 TRINITY_DN396_c0_g1~~TRINITY_DN396_c0_g1_i1.p2  ORF type:complete len:124 (+),score=32.18 TRINITY_DN396_c0_g1_i1:75-446(+)
MGWGGKGKGSWQWVPSSSKGKGKGTSKGKVKGGGFEKRKRTDSRDDDPPGSCRVFVRGFDFGTTDEQFEGHMKQAGPIHAVYWTTKGSAVVVYKKKMSKAKAAALDGTTIDGNERFISVVTSD